MPPRRKHGEQPHPQGSASQGGSYQHDNRQASPSPSSSRPSSRIRKDFSDDRQSYPHLSDSGTYVSGGDDVRDLHQGAPSKATLPAPAVVVYGGDPTRPLLEDGQMIASGSIPSSLTPRVSRSWERPRSQPPSRSDPRPVTPAARSWRAAEDSTTSQAKYPQSATEARSHIEHIRSRKLRLYGGGEARELEAALKLYVYRYNYGGSRRAQHETK